MDLGSTLLYMNRSSYNSKFFLLPVMAFSVLYTLPKFFELRLKTLCDCDAAGSNATNSTAEGGYDYEEEEFE